jgi:hypothetical protein
VSIGFILICVVLWADSFNLNEIVRAQENHVWRLNGFVFNPLLFPMWVMFLISGMAETARAPFDLTEAESELVAGYQTEYSSMSFALYWLGEYANVLLMCALNAVLFFGGWLPPVNVDLIPWFDIPGVVWLLGKILFFFFIFSWVKATVPRYRYDQLMRLGWKVFLPVSLGFVVLVSGWLMTTRYNDLESSDFAGVSPSQLESADATEYCVLKSGPKRFLVGRKSLGVFIRREGSLDNPKSRLRILAPSEFVGSYDVDINFREWEDSQYKLSRQDTGEVGSLATWSFGMDLSLTDASGIRWNGQCRSKKRVGVNA